MNNFILLIYMYNLGFGKVGLPGNFMNGLKFRLVYIEIDTCHNSIKSQINASDVKDF